MDRIKAIMSVMKDTNPVHIDEDLARRRGLRGVVNQGPGNLAYLTNMLTRWTGDPDSVKSLRVRFHNVVVPGDQVVAGGRVIAVRDDEVDCEVWLRLQDGTTNLSGTATLKVASALAR